VVANVVAMEVANDARYQAAIKALRDLDSATHMVVLSDASLLTQSPRSPAKRKTVEMDFASVMVVVNDVQCQIATRVCARASSVQPIKELTYRNYQWRRNL